ncbi:DHA2 family efflux MFS transporter permease subunit [Streptomyces sp. NPDC054834]
MSLRIDYKWRVVTIIVCASWLVPLDFTVVNVALGRIGTRFDVGIGGTQLTISSYTLALGAAIFTSGLLAGRMGRKRAFAFGLGIFAVGSVIAGTAPDFWVLITGRVIQGAGGGVLLPLGATFILDSFAQSERGKAMGAYGLAIVVAPALGPLVGGWFVDNGLWRWCFLINAPIALLALAMVWRGLRSTPGKAGGPYDVQGVALAIIGSVCLLIVMTQVSQGLIGKSLAVFAGLLVLGGAALFLFARRELRIGNPAFDIRLFGISYFRVGSLMAWIGSFGLLGAEFLFPLYLQQVRGISASGAGALIVPVAIAGGAISPLAGKLFDQYGPGRVMSGGFVLLIVDLALLATVSASTSIAVLVLMAILRGLCFGILIEFLGAAVLHEVTGPRMDSAMAMFSGFLQISQSLGVALLSTVLNLSSGRTDHGMSVSLSGIHSAYLTALGSACIALMLALRLVRVSDQKPKKSADPLVEVNAG